MKRCILLFVLFIMLCIPPLQAQRFAVGLSLGPVVSDVQGADTRDYDNDFYKVGFTAGAFVNRKMGRKNTLQLEINYVQKGTEQLPDSTNNGYFKLTLNYMEVPLLLRHRIRFNLNKEFYNNFEWELGASGGYLFSYSYVNSGYNIPLEPNTLNKIDVSLLGGINYRFPSGFYFGVRFSNSFIPVIKHSAIPTQAFSAYPFSFNNGDNMAYQFCLKYVFGGGGRE